MRARGKRVGEAERADACQHVAADLVEAPEREAEILAADDLDAGRDRDGEQRPAADDRATSRNRSKPLEWSLHRAHAPTCGQSAERPTGRRAPAGPPPPALLRG